MPRAVWASPKACPAKLSKAETTAAGVQTDTPSRHRSIPSWKLSQSTEVAWWPAAKAIRSWRADSGAGVGVNDWD